jgi:hypothetical protein
MTEAQSDNSTHTGGCQCGAIRYRIEGGLEYPHLCHCRMCQKAAGNYFMPLGFAPGKMLTITRGEPGWFQSSDPVRRGFCRDCGTPLFFDTLQSDGIAVTLGSLDDPAAFPPVANDGMETRVSFHAALDGLPAKSVDRDDLPGGLESIASSNHQHPDHDTAHWGKP